MLKTLRNIFYSLLNNFNRRNISDIFGKREVLKKERNTNPFRNFNKNTLNNTEIDEMLIQINDYFYSKNFKRVIELSSFLINKSDNNFLFYEIRARAFSNIFDFNNAIKDLKKAIELNPDNSEYYWLLGGYLLSREYHLNKNIRNCKMETLIQVTNYYKISIEKDPTCEEAYIDIMEIYLFMNLWDEAVSYYGQCKSLFKSKRNILFRAFLGCLALVLAGEDLDMEDEKPLLEKGSVKLSNADYRISEIDSYIKVLKNSDININKIYEVERIYNLFLSFYIEKPEIC